MRTYLTDNNFFLFKYVFHLQTSVFTIKQQEQHTTYDMEGFFCSHLKRTF